MKRLMQALFLVCFLGGLAAAQQPKKDDEGFEAVNGDMMQQGETIPGSRLVGALTASSSWPCSCGWRRWRSGRGSWKTRSRR